MKGAESDYVKSVGANVRRRRLQLGLTQESLSEKGSFNLRFYRYIEAGHQDVTVSMLARLARALECEPADLVKFAKPVNRKPGRPRSRKVES